MGIFHSKVVPNGQHMGRLSIDPRSPTVNIDRSPISLEEATGSDVTCKSKNVSNEISNEISPFRVTVGLDKFQSAFDPRSPSCFTRTPMLLNDSGASNVSLRGSACEFHETLDTTTPEEDGSLFEDCRQETSVAPEETESLFSELSLQAEMKATVENIIEQLYTIDTIDPRSPSENIQRTPIVFDNDTSTIKTYEQNLQEKVEEKHATSDSNETDSTEPSSNEPYPVRVQDVTPKQEQEELESKKHVEERKLTRPRTPLGCVTNVHTPTGVHGSNYLRKSVLFRQLQENAAKSLGKETIRDEVANNGLQALKKSQRPSKIPTLRIK